MDPKWHVAIQNDVITEYAGMKLKDYYSAPANMLEAQLKAKEVAQKRFGIGKFVRVYIDSPPHVLSSMLGVDVVYSGEDEVPSVGSPIICDISEGSNIKIGDPKKDGLMGERWKAYTFFREKGYPVDLGGEEGSLVTTAAEVRGDDIFIDLKINQEGIESLFSLILQADLTIRGLNYSLTGIASQSAAIYDDFAGLLSPEIFREVIIPFYEKIYSGKTNRFLHSELLRCEHLQIAKDLLGITHFHGAAAKNLELSEIYEVMSNHFTAQLAPGELLTYTPRQIRERIKILAGSGAELVQIFPGRSTPVENMEIAIVTVQKECPGGPWS